MAMVCPRCQGVFQQLWNCPSCKVRLGYQGAARVPLAADDDTAGQWQQTPWGRIAIGVVLAQGLYYGLRQLLVAGLMASGDEAAGAVWPTLTGLLVLQGVQAAGLIVAGLFAGAGQRQGIVFGVVVGVWNGVLTVLIQSLSGPHTTVTLLGQPILHTALGALGGFIGGSIWRAPQSLVVPVLAGAKGPERAKGTRVRAALFAGPIAWTRVFAGTALAVGGTLWAHVILELVMEASDGTLSIDNHLQAQLVTWEVTALAMLAGAAVAGSCTTNSLKQGLTIGLTVSLVLIGLRVAMHQSVLSEVLLTLISSVGLGLAGAWFGGALFPPLGKARPKGLGPEAA